MWCWAVAPKCAANRGRVRGEAVQQREMTHTGMESNCMSRHNTVCRDNGHSLHKNYHNQLTIQKGGYC